MRVFRWKCLVLLAFLAVAALLPLSACSTAEAQPTTATLTLPEALASGQPTLAEFGRGACIPCKEMKPILEDLAIVYQGKLNVLNINIDDYADLTRQNKISVIPTQICFDSSGKEVTRHIGVWPKEEIVAQLSKMSVR